jgi:hypothetical protein
MNPLYLLGSLAGVALLVALNLVLTGRKRVRVDLERAGALLAAEQPGFRPGRQVLATDGDAALLEDETGALYLVAGAGDGLVSRMLSTNSMRAVSRDGETLVIRLRDLTFPRARLALADEAEAKDWQARLARLIV